MSGVIAAAETAFSVSFSGGGLAVICGNIGAALGALGSLVTEKVANHFSEASDTKGEAVKRQKSDKLKTFKETYTKAIDCKGPTIEEIDDIRGRISYEMKKTNEDLDRLEKLEKDLQERINILEKERQMFDEVKQG